MAEHRKRIRAVKYVLGLPPALRQSRQRLLPAEVQNGQNAQTLQSTEHPLGEKAQRMIEDARNWVTKDVWRYFSPDREKDAGERNSPAEMGSVKKPGWRIPFRGRGAL